MAAKVQYINEGFTSGEISQELQGRVSSDTYKESVSAIENMVSTVQGAAIRRPGSKFVAEAEYVNADFGHRLIPYTISASRGVMLHVGPSTVVAYDQGGVVTASGVGVGAVINANPYFFNQLNGWIKRNYSAAPVPPHLFYGGPGGDVSWDPLRPSALFQVQSGTGGFIWFASAALVQAVVLEPNTQYELTFIASSPTPIASPGTPNPNPGHVRLVEVSSPTDFFPATTGYVTNVLATLPYSVLAQTGTISFTTPNWGANRTAHLEVMLGLQGTSYNPATFTSTRHGIDSYLTTCKVTKSGLPLGIVSFPSPWAGKDITDLSFAQTPESPSKLILAHPDVATQQLIYNPSTDAWSLTPVVFVAPQWGAAFPGTVGIHLNRLVLASSRANPERLWFSQALNYFTFTPGSNPADSFYGDLSEPGRVRWVRSMWSLVVGAESGIWDISAISGTVLGPGNAKAFKHQAHSASNAVPAFTNNEVAYIANGSRRLYSVRREGDENTYVDRELSFTARHLPSSGYRDIAWAEFPNNTMWSSMSEAGYGTLIAATYDPKMLVMAGWHRHNVGGTVHAVGAVSVGGIEQVFLLVGREKAEETYLSVERLDWSTYLDASVLRTYAAPTAIVTSLGHLEGQSVYALGSTGIVYGPHTVASAQITLIEPVTSVIVGLSFMSRIITKRPETIISSGTAQGLKKRWNKVFVRVSPGSRPIINGYRPPERDPAVPMDHGQPVSYEDVEVTAMGWSKEGYIIVEEFLPVQLVVAAVFGHVTAEIL